MHFLESLEREIDWQHEFEKLEDLVISPSFYNIPYADQTLENWISSRFVKWTNRGNFTSFQELRKHLGFSYTFGQFGQCEYAKGVDQNKYFLYCEMIVNLIRDLKSPYNSDVPKKYSTIHNTIHANLEQTGYEWRDLGEQVGIVKKNALMSEVAKIAPDLSRILLEYNHFRMKGNLKRKKELLNEIAFALEPMRNELKSICERETSDFFYLVNNMDIRHNNSDPKDRSNYNASFARLSNSEKEEWYDTIYAQALMLYARKEQLVRNRIIAEFKQT